MFVLFFVVWFVFLFLFVFWLWFQSQGMFLRFWVHIQSVCLSLALVSRPGQISFTALVSRPGWVSLPDPFPLHCSSPWGPYTHDSWEGHAPGPHRSFVLTPTHTSNPRTEACLLPSRYSFRIKSPGLACVSGLSISQLCDLPWWR